jgi:hypothetical protein
MHGDRFTNVHYGRAMPQHRILPVQLRAFCSVSIPMPVAQVLPDECAITVWKVAAVDLLRSVVQLMAIPTTAS